MVGLYVCNVVQFIFNVIAALQKAKFREQQARQGDEALLGLT
jgi:hypothetical protein